MSAFGTAARMGANMLMGAGISAYQDAGNGWAAAMEEVARTLVRPDLAGFAMVQGEVEMDVFGRMVSPMTPGLNYARNASLPSLGMVS